MNRPFLESVSCAFILTISSFCLLPPSRLKADEIDYQRDIQPILSERCAHCHGMDEATREGGLRLDSRQSALKGGDSGEPAIVPGRPDESELLRRVTSEDAGELMPPPDDHERLSETQVEKLRQWIQQDAAYAVHWSLVAPEKCRVARRR